MKFYRHPNLEGLHAPFSPSQSHWLRYDDDKAVQTYINKKAAEKGTLLHQWAKDTIDLGIKQPRSEKTLYRYVNDAIGYKMSTEVVLFYSERLFGTADSICFRKGKDWRYLLRIHDLKTGTTPVKMEQLEIYAALFCLEYKYKPKDMDMELRIYQNDEILYSEPAPEKIEHIMEHIIHLDKVLDHIEKEDA